MSFEYRKTWSTDVLTEPPTARFRSWKLHQCEKQGKQFHIAPFIQLSVCKTEAKDSKLIQIFHLAGKRRVVRLQFRSFPLLLRVNIPVAHYVSVRLEKILFFIYIFWTQVTVLLCQEQRVGLSPFVTIAKSNQSKV